KAAALRSEGGGGAAGTALVFFEFVEAIAALASYAFRSPVRIYWVAFYALLLCALRLSDQWRDASQYLPLESKIDEFVTKILQVRGICPRARDGAGPEVGALCCRLLRRRRRPKSRTGGKIISSPAANREPLQAPQLLKAHARAGRVSKACNSVTGT